MLFAINQASGSTYVRMYVLMCEQSTQMCMFAFIQYLFLLKMYSTVRTYVYLYCEFMPSQEWFRLGVQHKHVIVTDRTAPEVGSIEECVRMIEDLSSRKHSVYVHCKAGKGRSATVVACYLLKVRT